MNKENIRQIIIYGAGVIGNKNHEFLKRNSLDQYIYAFCDRNYENIKEIDGIPVISYESAKETGKSFVICLKKDKKSLIQQFEKDDIPYYRNLGEWILAQFEGQERTYLTYLYKNQDATDEPFELFGNMEKEFFYKLQPHLHGVNKIYGGYCNCCESDTFFVARGSWLRTGNYRCVYCNSITRQRALMSVLNKIRPNWRDMSIHECSPSGPIMKLMQEKCRDYTYSYFYDSLPLGERLDDNSTNQNIECMTFADESFDIYITQDVLEHVNQPYSALQEIARVLKPGGIHIFTVPLYFIQSRPRIQINDGKVENILPPVYHGNPISREGSLVTFDWGADVLEIMERTSGMKTELYDFRQTDENMQLGLEADFLRVLVAYKE